MLFDLSNTHIYALYQGIGIVAAILCAFSFQFKKNKTFLLFQFIVSIMWAFHFFIGNAMAAFIMNSVCIFRALGYYFIKNKKGRIVITVFLSLAFAAAAICSCIFFEEKWFIALVTGSASIVGTISLAIDNNKLIRWIQLCYVSPGWLFNNIFYASIGGIICESMNWVSALVALIRFSLDKSKAKQKEKDV